jgi:hypothetical protein
MQNKIFVKIRFNTNYKEGDGSKEWRVIINGIENFCNHVIINCPSKTTKDFIEGVGDKWHISCEPKHIDYIKDEMKTESTTSLFKEIILS